MYRGLNSDGFGHGGDDWIQKLKTIYEKWESSCDDDPCCNSSNCVIENHTLLG